MAVGIFARGRIAWILALILGVILIVVGAFTAMWWLLVVGVLFFLFGLVFLILSFVTHGQSD
jgi:membrane-bound ClpP family serine protease